MDKTQIKNIPNKEEKVDLHCSFPTKQGILKELFHQSILKNIMWIDERFPRIDNNARLVKEERKEFSLLNSSLFQNIGKTNQLTSSHNIFDKTDRWHKVILL